MRGTCPPSLFIKSKFVPRSFSLDSCVLDMLRFYWNNVYKCRIISIKKQDSLYMMFTFPWQSVTQFGTSRHDLARTRGPALYSTFIEVAMSLKRQKTDHSFFYEKVKQRKLASE